MIEEELQRKIEDFRDLGIPAYVPRTGTIHLVDGMVSTIVGARRAGKSFRALQVVDDLLGTGFVKSVNQVCVVDFDNPILSVIEAKDLKLIESTLLRMTEGVDLKTPLVFILDEIHKIEGWEQYVIDLSRNPRWKVIVTGSSSKLLRDQVATELRGKAVSSTVYPLSFSEFLKFRDFEDKRASTAGQAKVRRLFDEFMKWGGYPAVANLEEYSRESLLRQYFDTMILRDIIQRYNVSKPHQCTQLCNYLLSGIGKPHTLQSAYKFLKESGYATSRDAVREYVGWAEDSWLIFTVPIHSHSHKEQERNYRKIYCVDWALALRNSLVWDGSYSRAFENIVFLELFKIYPRVRYYLTRKKREEVDFLVSDSRGHVVLAVQVCMDITAKDTLDRELRPLVAAAKYFGIKENLIITMNQEEKLTREGITVRVVPAWKWLLELESK
ncbi:MAG: ATP-binding protein [Kiritimatiellia bacterium]